MLITGNQLKAARALAGVDQAWVAKAANVAINTVRNMESRGVEPITSGAVTVRNVQLALERAGVDLKTEIDRGEIETVAARREGATTTRVRRICVDAAKSAERGRYG